MRGNKNQFGFMMKRGMVIFAFCRRNPVGIFKPVLPPQKSEVYVTLLHFFQIYFIDPMVGRRQQFEKKWFKKFPEQGVGTNVFMQHLPFSSKFCLHTANKYFHLCHIMQLKYFR